MAKLLALSLLIFCLASSPAAPQEQELAGKFAGVWRLVSIEGHSPTFHLAYDRPTGILMYDRSGWMMVEIARKAERKPFANGVDSGTLEEKAAAFDSYGSYYGTYTVDVKKGSITHHLVDNSVPGFRGHDNVRWFEFQGNDRIVLIPQEDGHGGVIARRNATYKLTWERVKGPAAGNNPR